MSLFRIIDGKLRELKPNLVGKEKILQRLVEENLLEVLDTYFLETEYKTTSGGRIDTLGVDRTGAPTIIEYKRDQNDNVINQALSYLKWLKTQKSGFFEKLMQDRLHKDGVGKVNLDWKNPRIICIAASFNRFDVDTVEIVPIKIELMTYHFYEDGIFSLNTESSSAERQTPQPSVKYGDPDSDKDIGLVEKLRAHASDEMKMVFDDLRARIIALGPQVVERPTSAYVAYRVSKNFLELHIQKSQIKIYLRPTNFDDPEGRITKVSEKFGWTLDRQVLVKSAEDLAYVMKLIEQSYNDV